MVRQLYYHHLEIRITSTSDTHWDAWPGAVLRNNFLRAAEDVPMAEDVTLFKKIEKTCPLHPSHPKYSELQEGWPKGYLFAMNNGCLPELYLKKGEPLCFSLFLIGHMSEYLKEFIQTVYLMCQRGLGHPRIPFSILDICEWSLDGQLHIISKESDSIDCRLIYPVVYDDFLTEPIPGKKKRIDIEFITPVDLFNYKKKKDSSRSYQDKSNYFPGFYQLVRSARNRMTNLTALFSSPEKTDILDYSQNEVDQWLEQATGARLLAVDLKQAKYKSPPKKDSKNTVPLRGYLGRQQYEGYIDTYLPILKFMEALGIGNETVYGLGRYNIRIKNC